MIYSLVKIFYNETSCLMHKEVSKNILREIAFHVDKYIYMADTVLQKVFNKWRLFMSL